MTDIRTQTHATPSATPPQPAPARPLQAPAVHPATPAAADLARLSAIVEEKASAVAQKIPALGPVAWLLSQQAATRHVTVGALVERVMPALALGQARLHQRGGLPRAFVSWARLSEEAALRFRTAPHRLAPADWQSGTHIWLVDVLAPFDGPTPMLRHLRATLFAGQPVYALGVLRDGVAEVVDLSGGEQADDTPVGTASARHAPSASA